MKVSNLVKSIAAASGMGLASRAKAAISVPVGGYTETFPGLPTIVTPVKTDVWTTSLIGTSTSYTSVAGLDPVVAAISQTTLTPIAGDNGLRSLSTTTTLPPTNTSALTRHNTNAAGGFAQFWPTGNAATVLVFNLTNTTGTDATGANVSFDLTQVVANGGADGYVSGLRLYYSTTAEPGVGAFAPIADYAASVAAGTPVSVVVPWANGATIYFAFVDVNGDGATDPAWALDNVKFVPTGSVPEPASLGVIGLGAIAALRRRR